MPRRPERYQNFKRWAVRGVEPLTTTAARSQAMSRVRRTGTTPELAVRSVLSGLAIRYTLQNRDLPGSPDVANRRRRFVVFVHGCYWHRHEGCRRTTTPKHNRAFWQAKFEANVRRDRRVIGVLRRFGFRVVVVWECQTTDAPRLAARLDRLLSSVDQG